MISKISRPLAAAAVAAALALTGCSSDSSPSASPASTAPPAASTPTESSPTASSPTEAASPSETTGSDPGDSSAKPAKADIVTGLAGFYEKSQALSADKAKKFATCMVDFMYTKAKPATLAAMRDGDPTKIDKSDAGLIAEAGNSCQSALQ